MSSYKQAQESILGAILVDSKNVMPLVADKLTAENFINPECERVFAACLSLFQEQKHISFGLMEICNAFLLWESRKKGARRRFE